MATLEDIKKQLQSDRKVNEAISRGTHDTLRTNKKILAEILEHFKGIKAAAAVEAADRKEQKREDATSSSTPGGSSRFSGYLPKGVKDGLGSLMGFVKKGLLIAAIPAIIAFINSDYWPKFRDTMISLAKKIKEVYDSFIKPVATVIAGVFTQAWEGFNKYLPEITDAVKLVNDKVLQPVVSFLKDVFFKSFENMKVLFVGEDGNGGLKGTLDVFKKKGILAGLEDGFLKIFDYFDTQIGMLITEGWNQLIAPMFSLTKIDGTPQFTDLLKQMFVGIFDKTKESIGDLINYVSNLIDKIFSYETLEAIYDKTFGKLGFDNPFTQMIRDRNSLEKNKAAIDITGEQGLFELGGITADIKSQILEIEKQRQDLIKQRDAIAGEGNVTGFGLYGEDLEKFKKINLQFQRLTADANSLSESLGFTSLDRFKVNEGMMKKTFAMSVYDSFSDILTPNNKAVTNPDYLKGTAEEIAKVLEERKNMDLSTLDRFKGRTFDPRIGGGPINSNNGNITNVGDPTAYLINGATSTHDASDPKLLYGTDQI